MNKNFPAYLLLSLVVVLVAAGYILLGRAQVENRNHAVSIAGEYEVLEPLAASEGLTMREALAILKTEGLRSVVLSEETAGELASGGSLAAREVEISGNGGRGLWVQAGPKVLARISKALQVRYPLLPKPQPIGRDGLFVPRLTGAMFRALSLGINPEASQIVTDAKLEVIARMGNPVGISPSGVYQTINWAAENHAKVFLPQGDQVLGRRQAMESLEKALVDNKMSYASPEFAKLGGDINFLQRSPELVIRLHSAQAAELDKLRPEEVIDRYTRAARERNMRILLVRPIDFSSDRGLHDYGTLVNKIGKKLVKYGFKLETPHPFSAPNTKSIAYAVLGLAAAPIAYFVMEGLGPGILASLLGAIGVALGLACFSEHFRQYEALFSAITFPIAAFRAVNPSRGWLQNYGLVFLFSLLGGLLVASELSSLPYYIRAAEFPGVKVAVFAPILGVGVLSYCRLANIKVVWQSPITWGTLILGFLLLGALAFMLERTGNDNPAAVSSFELKLRNILDAVLYVRPRTKSMVIGFPGLVIGLQMLSRWAKHKPDIAYGAWTALFLMVGAIAATDVVNTLCHIHTPFTLSLIRIGLEFILGTLIGMAIWSLVGNFFPTMLTPRTAPLAIEDPIGAKVESA